MDSRFSRFVENTEIDKTSECMSCAEYYFTFLHIKKKLKQLYTTYYEKTNLWSYHNYRVTLKNRFFVLTNAFKNRSKI